MKCLEKWFLQIWRSHENGASLKNRFCVAVFSLFFKRGTLRYGWAYNSKRRPRPYHWKMPISGIAFLQKMKDLLWFEMSHQTHTCFWKTNTFMHYIQLKSEVQLVFEYKSFFDRIILLIKSSFFIEWIRTAHWNSF